MPLRERPLPAPLPEIFAAPPSAEARLYWLGQAGFVIDGGGRRVVIDPYLSDSLAEKYRGKKFDHQRMMPAPVTPNEILHVDAVLATHAHTDHLDPGTLPLLLAANPAARLVAPAAMSTTALERARIAAERLIALDAGKTVQLFDGLHIAATRAAHEELDCDNAGQHLYLGYAITIGTICIYHSGDTIPFTGLSKEVAAKAPEVALLPVNGRDAERRRNGVPGNLTLREARELALAAKIPAMIAHHFDMFSFNTVPRSEVEAFAASTAAPTMFAASTGVFYGP